MRLGIRAVEQFAYKWVEDAAKVRQLTLTVDIKHSFVLNVSTHAEEKSSDVGLCLRNEVDLKLE